MSHIAKHRVDIAEFNMDILSDSADLVKKYEHIPLQVKMTEKGLEVYRQGMYRPMLIKPDGEIIYDSMDKRLMLKMMDTLNKYYLAVSSLISLRSMGYDVDMRVSDKGEIQILGVQ